MNSKKINELVGASYRRLDKKRVDIIASNVSTIDLKKYINKLKKAEKENTLTISSSSTLDKKDLKKILELLPHKKVILEKDPSLMLGLRIAHDDMIYDFTLKDSLNNILGYVEQNYDQ